MSRDPLGIVPAIRKRPAGYVDPGDPTLEEKIAYWGAELAEAKTPAWREECREVIAGLKKG